MHLTETLATTSFSAKIYYAREFNEYRVRFFHGGVLQRNADYFTDTKQDAIDTARHQIDLWQEMDDLERQRLQSKAFKDATA